MESPNKSQHASLLGRPVLTIIGICAILGLVVFISIQYRRAVAEEHRSHWGTRCLGNTGIASRSILLYSADNDDYLPLPSKWMDAVKSEQLKQGTTEEKALSFLRCPALEERSEKDIYGYAFLDKARGAISAIEEPMTTPMIIESSDLSWNAHGDSSLLPSPARHGFNVMGYVDGHATSVRAERLTK